MNDPEELRSISRSLKAAVSFETAVAIWGIRTLDARPHPVLTVARDRSRARCDGVDLHRADLAPGDVLLKDGIRLTSPLRTVSTWPGEKPRGGGGQPRQRARKWASPNRAVGVRDEGLTRAGRA